MPNIHCGPALRQPRPIPFQASRLRGDARDFDAELAEFIDELCLRSDFFALAAARVWTGVLLEGEQLALLMPELLLGDLADAIEGVLGEPLVVEPDGV